MYETEVPCFVTSSASVWLIGSPDSSVNDISSNCSTK